MPDTNNSTTPAVAAKPGKSSGPEAPGMSVDTLIATATALIEAKPDTRAREIGGEFNKYLIGVLPKTSRPEPADICTNAKPVIAAFCATRDLAYQAAELTFDGSMESANSDFRTAVGVWRMARNTYSLSRATAQAALNQAVAAAVAAYQQAINDDSRSREWYLFYTMKLAIAQAVETFQASLAAAADTLAGGLGALIAAHQAYSDAVAAAQCQRMIDDASADQSFWQSVENVLDAVP